MVAKKRRRLPGLPKGVKPYDWALKQLRVARAHKLTRGRPDVVVAIIDLGYRHHPDMTGHLWKNPNPRRGDIHGWDFFDDDASLEYRGRSEDGEYQRGHHVFVSGEVAATAPRCPIMIVRVGYGNPDSWWRGIRYAVDHGARVLGIPHGYLTGEREYGDCMFYKGGDFSYPFDNPKIRDALDYAYDKGCLIVRGTAGNRGRRVAAAFSGVDAVFTVGSTNRRDAPADICCSADYVEAGAPAGDRDSTDERDRIWGCGGDRNYISFTGGCMAVGFGCGVAGLVWSKFPNLTNDQLRQVLRNTARPARQVNPDAVGWEPQLGYGILDAAKAVSLKPEALCRDVRLVPSSVTVRRQKGGRVVSAQVRNHGAFDAEKAMVVAYNGDSKKPVEPEATTAAPAKTLQTKQIGHAIVRVRGLHRSAVRIELTETPGSAVWFETFCLDRHDGGKVHYARRRLP